MAHDPIPTDQDQIHPFAKPFMFLVAQKFVNNFIWFTLAGLVLMLILGFVYPFDPKHKAPWDFFGSWALIGFFAYSFVVFSAKPLFKFLARPESFYGEEVDPEIVMGEPQPALDEIGEGH